MSYFYLVGLALLFAFSLMIIFRSIANTNNALFKILLYALIGVLVALGSHLFDYIVTIENYYRGLLFSVLYFTLAGAIGGLMNRFIKAKNKFDNTDLEG